jgi:hypothetical protein
MRVYSRVCKHALLVGLTMLLAINTTSAEGAAVKVKASETKAVLENQFLRVTINAKGGDVVSLYDKIAKRDCTKGTPTEPMTGLCNSRIWEKNTYGELLEADYDVKVTRQTDDLAEVECRYTGRDGALMSGVTFIKRYSLERNAARLNVHYRIEAGDRWSEFSPWLHNAFALPRDKAGLESTRLYAQQSKGLWSNPALFPSQSNHLIWDMNEPWLAAITENKAEGITMIVSPESSLQKFFCWTGSPKMFTMEVLFNKQKFAPNASFGADLIFMPNRGLKACHFATEDYAGSFQKENGEAVLVLYPAASLGKAKVSVLRGNKAIGTGQVTLRTGKPVSIPVKLGKELQSVQVTIAIGGKTRTHTIRASTQSGQSEVSSSGNLESSKADKANAAKVSNVKKCLYVSNEMALVAPFAMRQTFKKPTMAEFVIEFPEGIKATLTAQSFKGPKDLKTEKITIKGKPYTRYSGTQSARNYWGWIMVFMETTWKPGQTGKAYFYCKWDGGEQPKTEIDIEAITVGSAPQPKRLITNLGWMSIDVHKMWPDFHRVMKQVGVNTLCSGMYDAYKPIQLKAAVDKAKAEGFWFAQNHSPFLRSRHRKAVKKENATAIDMHGKPCKLGHMSPSYRGPAFDAEVEHTSNCAKAGISMLWHDPEIWRGAEFCFRAESLKKFKSYLKKKHPKLKHMDPRKFEVTPHKHPKLHQAWINFRISLGTELFLAIRKSFNEKVRKYKANSSPGVIVGSYGMWPGKIYHQFLRFDEQYKADAINTCMPSLYVAGNAPEVARRVRQYREKIGKNDLIPWLSAGYGIPSSECESIDVKYMVLENFLNGARGFTSYTWYGFDGMDLKYLVEAMNMIVPVEDIIMDAELMDEVRSSSLRAKACGMVSGEEGLVLVRDYFSNKKITTTLTLPTRMTGEIIDMESGEKVGSLTKGKRFKITIDKKRVRLLYIGRKNPLK